MDIGDQKCVSVCIISRWELLAQQVSRVGSFYKGVNFLGITYTSHTVFKLVYNKSAAEYIKRR